MTKAEKAEAIQAIHDVEKHITAMLNSQLEQWLARRLVEHVREICVKQREKLAQ